MGDSSLTNLMEHTAEKDLHSMLILELHKYEKHVNIVLEEEIRL